jgi:hypothetical protein
MYRWSGTAWTDMRDAAIGVAQSTAAGAQATANAKNKTYYQTTAPTGGTYAVGDLWFDTDADNKPHRWDGSTWVAVPFGDAAIVANIDAGKISTGTLSANLIGANSITAQKMAANSITAANAAIMDGTIVNAKIATAAVDDLKVANVNVGKLVAGTLNADITVSQKIKTSSAYPHVVMDGTGLYAKDASNVDTFRINASNGAATFRGTVTASTITGGIVEGATVRTAAPGTARAEMGPGAIYGTKPGVAVYDGTAVAGRLTPNGNGYILSTGFDGAALSVLSVTAYGVYTFDGWGIGGVGGSLFRLTPTSVEPLAPFTMGDRTIFMRGPTDTNHTVRYGANGVDGVTVSGLDHAGFIVFQYASSSGAYLNSSGDFRVGHDVYASSVKLTSSRETKENIRAFSSGLADLRRLRPVQYERTHDSSGRELRVRRTEYGLIAEEVAQVLPTALAPADDEGPAALDLMALFTLTLKAVQELADTVDQRTPVGPGRP